MRPADVEPQAGSRSAIGTLDGLRALAVGLVLIEHLPNELLWRPLGVLGEAVPTGYLGVDLFFVLSGFLITRILIADRREGVPVRWFLARRSLRIFPAFYLLVAASWLLWGGTQIPWWSVATYTINFAIPFGHSAGFLQHTWSLAVEEHFYLLWPLFMAFAPRRALLPVAAFVLIPTALGLALWFAFGLGTKVGFDLIMYGTQCRMLSLLIGACLAFGEHRWRRAGWAVEAAALVAVVVGIQLIREVQGIHGVSWSLGRYLGSAVACTGAVVLAVRADRHTGWGPLALAARVLRVRPIAHLGRISYGIYLYHNPIIFLVGVQVLTRELELASWHLAAAVALTWAVSELSFWCYERPFLKLKRHFSAAGRDRAPAAAA